MRFDLCYICLLCAIILVTFFAVLLPQPALLASLDLYSMQLLTHITVQGPSPRTALLLSILGLIYLKIIWRLINPPQRF